MLLYELAFGGAAILTHLACHPQHGVPQPMRHMKGYLGPSILCGRESFHSKSGAWTEESLFLSASLAQNFLSEQVAGSRMGNTNILTGIWKERNPYVLGCINLKWSFHIAELRSGS